MIPFCSCWRRNTYYIVRFASHTPNISIVNLVFYRVSFFGLVFFSANFHKHNERILKLNVNVMLLTRIHSKNLVASTRYDQQSQTNSFWFTLHSVFPIFPEIRYLQRYSNEKYVHWCPSRKTSRAFLWLQLRLYELKSNASYFDAFLLGHFWKVHLSNVEQTFIKFLKISERDVKPSYQW